MQLMRTHMKTNQFAHTINAVGAGRGIARDSFQPHLPTVTTYPYPRLAQSCNNQDRLPEKWCFGHRLPARTYAIGQCLRAPLRRILRVLAKANVMLQTLLTRLISEKHTILLLLRSTPVKPCCNGSANNTTARPPERHRDGWFFLRQKRSTRQAVSHGEFNAWIYL